MELQKRITDKMNNVLNLQNNKEYYSFYLYRHISNWCDCYGFYKAKSLFRKYASEELTHASKLEDYIIDQNGEVTIVPIDYKGVEFKSLIQVIKAAYDHEKTITDNYKALLNIALEEKDQKTYSFLQWFIDEQTEEENKFADAIILAERLGITDTTTGIELIELEEFLVNE